MQAFSEQLRNQIKNRLTINDVLDRKTVFRRLRCAVIYRGRACGI